MVTQVEHNFHFHLFSLVLRPVLTKGLPMCRQSVQPFIQFHCPLLHMRVRGMFISL